MAFDLEPDVSCTHTLMPPGLVASVECTVCSGVWNGVLCERCALRVADKS